MTFEFTNKPALLFLLAIPFVVYAARYSFASLGRHRRWVSILWRIAILLLIVLALSGIRLRTRSTDIAVIFLVDVSASVAPELHQRAVTVINQGITAAGPRDYVGVIAFGREPSVELAPTRREALGNFRMSAFSSNPPADYTDIAAALRLAAALVPDDATGRLILISDGDQNLNDALDQSGLLRVEGIEVDAINSASPTVEERPTEVAVTDIAAPEKLSEGEAFDLNITVGATADSDATLRVFRNDALIAERPVHLTAQGDNVFSIQQRADQKGFYTFRAQVEALSADSFSQNNTREAFAIVEGRPKVLYLHGDAAPSPAMLRVLAEGSFAAQIRRAGELPSSLAGLQDYDLIIFDNVPASAMTKSQMEMVRAYVRELGGGFLMIGGDESFGPGGYYKTPIEDVLPVSLDVRRKKHLPSLALVLVIDKSGSMSGPKMQLTLEAAVDTVTVLSERDSVGVIAFDDAANVVVNLTRAENKDPIIAAVRSIRALGGTNMYPGLKMSFDWLTASEAQIKHVIVLSDGESTPGDFRGIARAIRDAGMTLTAVAVGDDADLQTMKFIADVGAGRFYATNSPENLPRILTSEAFLASRTTIIEEPFIPQLIRPTQATQGIDWGSAPALLGYVVTAERDQLESAKITSLVSDKGDPVYATWQYGLGRAAAFASDAKPRWAAGWMNWPGFGQFWTQALRDVLRREMTSTLEPNIEIGAGKGHITVEATTSDGGFANLLRPRATIIGPDLTSVELNLEQTASGRYEAEFEATSRGAYLVRISDEGTGSSTVTGAVNSYSPEFNIGAENTTLLQRLSDATGGKSLEGYSLSGDLFERRPTKTRPREIWQSLLLAALLALPFDVALRRVRLRREDLTSARDWLVSRLQIWRWAPAGGAVEAAPSLGQLKHARTRVKLSEPTGLDDRLVDLPGDKKATVSTPVQLDGAETGNQNEQSEQPLSRKLVEARRRRQREQ